jgi:hypothetical protein
VTRTQVSTPSCRNEPYPRRAHDDSWACARNLPVLLIDVQLVSHLSASRPSATDLRRVLQRYSRRLCHLENPGSNVRTSLHLRPGFSWGGWSKGRGYSTTAGSCSAMVERYRQTAASSSIPSVSPALYTG